MHALDVPILEGDEIRLRPFAVRDTDAVIAAGRDPLIPTTTTVTPHGDLAAALEFVERQHDRARDAAGYSFAIADAETDEAIGQMGIWLTEPANGRVRLGYWVVPDRRRRGVASRALRAASEFAFSLDGTVRAELFIEPWNTGSLRTAGNAGYRCEGLQRSAQRVGGVSRDMFLFGRLRSDDGRPAEAADLHIGAAAHADAAELLVLQRCCWVAEA